MCYFVTATSCLADMFTASSVIFGDVLVPPRLRLRHQSIGSLLSSEDNRSILDVSPAYFCFVFASSERAEERNDVAAVPLDHATLLRRLLLRSSSSSAPSLFSLQYLFFFRRIRAPIRLTVAVATSRVFKSHKWRRAFISTGARDPSDPRGPQMSD